MSDIHAHSHKHACARISYNLTYTMRTHTGTYLLSGGEESVLVLWQLETHKKQFRPRLGSPITKVACSPGDKYFTVGLQSNGEGGDPVISGLIDLQ